MAAAEYGSINRAAAPLGLSQPALTRSIGRLEEIVGAKLLHRTSRGVVPTEFGKALIKHVQAIDSELHQASTTIDLLKGNIDGVITCGAGPVSMFYLLPAAVNEFRKRWPRLHFRLVEGHTPASWTACGPAKSIWWSVRRLPRTTIQTLSSKTWPTSRSAYLRSGITKSSRIQNAICRICWSVNGGYCRDLWSTSTD